MRWTEADLKIFVQRQNSGGAKLASGPSKSSTPAGGSPDRQGKQSALKTPTKSSAPSLKSKLEERFLGALLLAGLPKPVRGHPGIPGRKYEFDFAWPGYMVAVEIEGGIGWEADGTVKKSRHSMPEGYSEDCRKYNLGQLHGWIVLRFTTLMLKEQEIGACLTILENALSLRSAMKP